MRAGQRNDSDPTGWPQWKPAPWLNWIEGGTRTQKLAIRFHWFNQPDDPPGARPDRPNNSHRPDNIAIQTECWNQSNASANWITAKFHAPTNLENKQSSGFEQSIQSFPNTHTHTHTHTHKEREREWRGKNRCLLQLLNSISKLGTGSMKTWGDYIKARLQFANWRCTTSWWQIQVGWRGVRGRNPHFLPPLLSPFLPLPPGAPSLHTRVLLMTHALLRKALGEG